MMMIPIMIPGFKQQLRLLLLFFHSFSLAIFFSKITEDVPHFHSFITFCFLLSYSCFFCFHSWFPSIISWNFQLCSYQLIVRREQQLMHFLLLSQQKVDHSWRSWWWWWVTENIIQSGVNQLIPASEGVRESLIYFLLFVWITHVMIIIFPLFILSFWFLSLFFYSFFCWEDEVQETNGSSLSKSVQDHQGSSSHHIWVTSLSSFSHNQL